MMSAACSIMTPQGRVMIGPRQARNLAARARAMRREGKSEEAIAQALKISAGSISAVLRVATHLGAPPAPSANRAPEEKKGAPRRRVSDLYPGPKGGEPRRESGANPRAGDYPDKAVRRLMDFMEIMGCGGEWLSFDRSQREALRAALGELIAFAQSRKEET